MKAWFPHSFFGDAAVSLGLRIGGATLGFAFNVLVARSLGIGDSGIFFLVIATMNVLPILARFGVDTVAARRVSIAHDAEDLSLLRGVVNAGVLIILTGSLLLSCALWILAPYLGVVWFGSADIVPLLRIAALAVLPIAVQKLFSDLLLVTQRVWQSQLIQMLLPQVVNCLAFYIFAAHSGVQGGVWAIVVSACVTASVSALLWWRYRVHRDGERTSPEMREFLGSCWAATGVAVAGLGISAVSPLFLGTYASKEDVALFSVAMRIAMLSNFVAYAVQNASMRKFSVLYAAGDFGALRKTVFEARRISTALFSGLLIPLMLFSDPVMGIFGEEFRQGRDILLVLCVGQLIVGFFGPVMPLLLMSGNEKVVRNCTVIAAVMNLPLHFFLVPIWGAMGAAFSFSLTFAGATVALAYFAKRLVLN